MGQTPTNLSIYDRIGEKGLRYIVWNSTPVYLRWSLPYGLKVYRDILRESSTLEDVLRAHDRVYTTSILFRKLRPRSRAAKPLLEKLLFTG